MAHSPKRSPLEYHRAILGALGLVYALSASEIALAVAWRRGLLIDPMGSLPALILLACPILLPLVLAAPFALPRAVRAPSRWYHVPAAIVVVVLLTAAGEFFITWQGLVAGLTAGDMTIFASTFLPVTGVALLVVVIVTSIRCVRGGGGGVVPAAASAASPARSSGADRRGEGPLPQVNGAMRILAAADFAGPRLLGLGLIGAAWLLWGYMADGRPERVADLARGLEPMAALALHVGLGVALIVPVLLTPWVGRPRHVAGGLVKAGIIAFAAWLLQEPLRLALSAVLSDLHRPLGLAIAPPAFLAVAAVIIFAAPVLAFFRQLGAVPTAVPADEAGPVMDPTTLRDLRLARMQV